MKLSNWPAWDEAFDRQLDAHHAAGTFGTPVPRPGVRPDGSRPNVFRIVWSNMIKTDGTRKARSWMDQSEQRLPYVNSLKRTPPVLNNHVSAFFALAAQTNKVVTFTANAYQQSPPPSEQGLDFL